MKAGMIMRLIRLIMLGAFLLFQVMYLGVEGVRRRHYKWEVSYMFKAPDCIEGLVIGINNQYPGPTIRATEGDTIVVELTNNLPTEGVVIHWHGIKQIGTPWADGTAYVTQCPINPKETFVYRFTVTNAGTYFYHGHYGMQRTAGLSGSLIVDLAEGKEEPFVYDEELNLVLSDWWHANIYTQMAGLSSLPFRWIGEPQSLLIQGKGQFNCSLSDYYHYHNSTTSIGSDGSISNSSSCQINNTQCPMHVIHVQPNKTYRLRIASITSLASLNFAISNHSMLLVESDGNYLDPISVDKLDVFSGDTYSVLITTNQDPSVNYWISINSRLSREPQAQPGLAILTYQPITNHTTLPPNLPSPSPPWNDTQYSLSFTQQIHGHPHLTPKPPKKSHRRIVLLNSVNFIEDHTRWLVNNMSLELHSTPFLISLKYGLSNALGNDDPSTSMNIGDNIYMLEFNSTVDVILQNSRFNLLGNSEIHIWHMHGHDFWILGYGEGSFDEEKDYDMLNFENPPLRNTVSLFSYGWTAIRFVADNPGAWTFHCHFEPHIHMGMSVIFVEGMEMVKEIPKESLGCGLTRMFMHG